MDFDEEPMRGVYTTFRYETAVVDLKTNQTLLTIDNGKNYRPPVDPTRAPVADEPDPTAADPAAVTEEQPSGQFAVPRGVLACLLVGVWLTVGLIVALLRRPGDRRG